MGGTRCTVCDHEHVEAINLALATTSERTVANRWFVTKAAVHRHKVRHVGPALIRAQAAREGRSAIGTLDALESLLQEALDLLSAAKSKGAIGDATRAIREAHQILATRGRLLGEFPKEGTTVNVDARTQSVTFAALTSEELRSLARLSSGPTAIAPVHQDEDEPD